MYIIKRALISLSLLGSLLILNTSAFGASCGKVHLGDFDWDSANVHTAIASFVLE